MSHMTGDGIVLRLARDDTPAALLEAALLVRRAGLEHLVDADVSAVEVEALAAAGELLAIESALLARRALVSPESLERVFDGGRPRRARLTAEALAVFAGEATRGSSS